MRSVIRILAWSGVGGGLIDLGIFCSALWWIFGTGEAAAGLTVDAHLRDHLGFLYWIKDFAYYLLDDGFVDWLFGLPALAYFPFRIVVNFAIGAWMFSLLRKRVPVQLPA